MTTGTRPAGRVPVVVSRGVTYAVVAYVLWGFFPWYFSLLSPASALEIAAVMRLHAMSASSWYISSAGYVSPLHTRQVSSHSFVMRFS